MVKFDTWSLKAGIYTIKYSLTSSLNFKKWHDIKIDLVCYTFLEKLQWDPLKGKIPLFEKQKDPPTPFIQIIDQFGRVRVAFDQVMWLPNFKRYPEFTEDPRHMMQNCTDEHAYPELCYAQQDQPSRRSRRALQSIVNSK